MHYRLLLSICVILSVTSGCSQTSTHENNDLTYADFIPGKDYTIQMPNGWHEVTKYNDVKKHIFWCFTNSNYTRFEEKPLFRAWDGPEDTHSFFTATEVKRHCSLSTSASYDEIIRSLKEMGWVIQESGLTKIDNMRTKWWVQSVSDGALHQKCYFVGHENKMYFFVFTTSYLSESKIKLFDTIVQSISFTRVP